MASTQWQRIQAHCKIIWGADRDFDITEEEVDDGSYLIFVREDRGTSLGNRLTSLGIIKGHSRAWNNLEQHVAELAKAKETEGWTPKVQPLDATAYPSMMHDFNAKAKELMKRTSENGGLK